MLYPTPRHNGDWSPPVQSGTAADRSHSCLPAFHRSMCAPGTDLAQQRQRVDQEPIQYHLRGSRLEKLKETTSKSTRSNSTHITRSTSCVLCRKCAKVRSHFRALIGGRLPSAVVGKFHLCHTLHIVMVQFLGIMHSGEVIGYFCVFFVCECALVAAKYDFLGKKK